VESQGQALAPTIEPTQEPTFEPQAQYIEFEKPRWETATLLWQGRNFLWKVTRNSFVIALLIVLLMPNHYQSTAQLMPPDMAPSTIDLIGGLAGLSSGGSVLGGGGGSGSGLSKLLGGVDQGEVFLGIMQSETLEDRLIDQFGLEAKFHDHTVEQARKDLESMVDLNVDRKSGIIGISVTDKNPVFASQLARAYVEQLNNLLSQVSNTTARRERVFLERRLSTVQTKLDDDARNFSQFASKNTALDISAQGQAMVQAAATLQGQIIAAQSELEGLKQIYTPDNYRIKQTQAQITELQNQLEKLGGKDVSVQRSTLNPDELYPSIRELPLLGVGWADLYRQLKIDETVYELLNEQAELARIEEARETPTVEVLDPGFVPQRKSWPPRILLSILVAFLSAVIAGIWVFAKQKIAEWDSQDERKLLLQDIYLNVSSHQFWNSKLVVRTRFIGRLVFKSAEALVRSTGRLLHFWSSPAKQA
jgi:capsule polysaccharide export protein KpsE/RkpR